MVAQPWHHDRDFFFEVDMEHQISPKMQKSVIYNAKTQKSAPNFDRKCKKALYIEKKRAKLISERQKKFGAPSAP